MSARESPSGSIHADVIVAGGGTSGAVIAARLAEAGLDVVVVEAGPDYGAFAGGRWPKDLLAAHALALSHDWGYGSGPLEGRQPWTYERARVISGCSAHNGCIAAVGHAKDYDAWRLPLWQTELLRPVFKTALEKMRVRTYQPEEIGPFHARCLEAAALCGWKMGEDLCDLDANDSFGRESVNIVDGIRWNTAFAYLDPVRGARNLRILDRTMIDRFVETAGGVTLTGWRDSKEVRLEAEHLILTAGVYGNPAILQRSGIGDPARLKAAGVKTVLDLKGVGANLHDHPMVHADRAIGPELQRWMDERAASGFLPEEQTLGKAISSQARDGIYDMHVFPAAASTQTALTNGFALVEVSCVTPKSRGRLDIVSADPDAAPRIDHRYLSDPEGHDIAVMRDGLVMAEAMLDAPPLKRLLGARRTDTSTDQGIRRNVTHYYHPVGTCKMGNGADAVCDERGRVLGLNRVTVGDVSLMPQVPRANTNIPAVVIGERVAGFMMDGAKT